VLTGLSPMAKSIWLMASSVVVGVSVVAIVSPEDEKKGRPRRSAP
jgi:hypothetical protein